MDGDIVVELRDTLRKVIEEAVLGKEAAVAFSGGLDSGIVAAMAGGYGKVGLYTVGAEGSYDVKESEEMAKTMGLPWKHLQLTEESLETNLEEMMRITGTVNPITLSFEIPLFYILKYSSEKIVMSGQGADELFAGYSKYEDLDHNELRDKMNDDMFNLMNVTIEHERKVAENFGKVMAYPYLDDRVTDIVKKIDIKDLAPRELRKAVLRDVAISMDRSDIAAKPKKAAQYGSGTMSLLRSMAKKKKTTVNGMISSISEGL